MLPQDVFVLQQHGLPLGIVLQQTVLPGQICLSYSSHCCPWRCLFNCSLFVSLYCTIPGGTCLQQPLLQLKTSLSRCYIVRFVCLQEHVLHLYMCFCVAHGRICLQEPVWCCTFTYVSVYLLHLDVSVQLHSVLCQEVSGPQQSLLFAMPIDVSVYWSLCCTCKWALMPD
jgi:hypothetical protein